MKFLQKTPTIIENELIGYNYIFDYDIEISTDMNGKIVDYSGCSYNKAFKLLKQTIKYGNNSKAI